MAGNNITYWFDELMTNHQNTIRLYKMNDTFNSPFLENNSGYLIAVAPYTPSNLKFNINNTWGGLTSTAASPYDQIAKAATEISEYGRLGDQYTSLANKVPILGNLVDWASGKLSETSLGNWFSSGINAAYSSIADEIKKFNGSTFSRNIPTLTCIYYYGFNYGLNVNEMTPNAWIQRLVNVSAGMVKDSDKELVRVINSPNKFEYSLSDTSSSKILKGTLTMVIGGSNSKKSNDTEKSTSIYIDNLVVKSLNVTYSDEYVNSNIPLYAIAEVGLERARTEFPTDNTLEMFGLTGPKVDEKSRMTGAQR